jgi:hypothetical protein
MAKRHFCLEMVTQKKNHWHTFLDDQNDLWEANPISKSVSHDTRIPALHTENRVAEDDEEKADVLMESFFPLLPPPEGPWTVRQAEEGQGIRPDPLPLLTDEEIETAVTWPNPNRAPGPYKIRFAAWRQLLFFTREWIRWLYQACLSLGHFKEEPTLRTPSLGGRRLVQY